MGIIHEDIKHPDFPVSITIVEREKGEGVEAWRVADLEIEFTGERFTPRELRELGRWLIQQGKRLGKSYTSKGAPRATKTQKEDPCGSAKTAGLITPI